MKNFYEYNKVMTTVLTLLISLSMNAQKFTPGKYLCNSYDIQKIREQHSIEFRNGKFTALDPNLFPIISSPSSVAGLSLSAVLFWGTERLDIGLEVYGTYSVYKPGVLKITITGTNRNVKLSALVKNYYFKFDSKSITISGKGNDFDYFYLVDQTIPAKQKKEAENKLSASKKHNNNEAVDLGLSVMWSSVDVGASSMEQKGCKFAFGEVSPLGGESSEKYDSHKYRGNPLMSSYDAASVNLGGAWRMPTAKEFNELQSKCTFTQEDRNGETLFKCTGPNGNSIYLHKGSYWSSTNQSYDYGEAYYLNIETAKPQVIINSLPKYGKFVRAVRPLTENEMKKSKESLQKAMQEKLENERETFANIHKDSTKVIVLVDNLETDKDAFTHSFSKISYYKQNLIPDIVSELKRSSNLCIFQKSSLSEQQYNILSNECADVVLSVKILGGKHDTQILNSKYHITEINFEFTKNYPYSNKKPVTIRKTVSSTKESEAESIMSAFNKIISILSSDITSEYPIIGSISQVIEGDNIKIKQVEVNLGSKDFLDLYYGNTLYVYDEDNEKIAKLKIIECKEKNSICKVSSGNKKLAEALSSKKKVIVKLL